MAEKQLVINAFFAYYHHGVIFDLKRNSGNFRAENISYLNTNLCFGNSADEFYLKLGSVSYNLLEAKLKLIPLGFLEEMIIKDIRSFLECSDNQVMEFCRLIDGTIRLDMITLGLYECLCKKHIDFLGLIPKGLAEVKLI